MPVARTTKCGVDVSIGSTISELTCGHPFPGPLANPARPQISICPLMLSLPLCSLSRRHADPRRRRACAALLQDPPVQPTDDVVAALRLLHPGPTPTMSARTSATRDEQLPVPRPLRILTGCSRHCTHFLRVPDAPTSGRPIFEMPCDLPRRTCSFDSCRRSSICSSKATCLCSAMHARSVLHGTSQP